MTRLAKIVSTGHNYHDFWSSSPTPWTNILMREEGEGWLAWLHARPAQTDRCLDSCLPGFLAWRTFLGERVRDTHFSLRAETELQCGGFRFD